MKEENKKDVKKGVMAGVGTATGAAIAAVVEDSLQAAASGTVGTVESELDGIVAEESAETGEDVLLTEAAAPVELDEVVVVAHAASPSRPSHSSTVTPVDAEIAYEEEAEEPIMAAVVSETPAVEEDLTDDILVVSEGGNVNNDAFAVHANVAAPGPEFGSSTEIETATVSDPMEMPDYLAEDDFAMKADGLSLSGTDSVDMPDYVNNANIDSFTEPV